MFRRMTRERYLTDAEIGRLMAVARDRRHVHQPRDYALLALLANTGIRPSEARAITVGDVHHKARKPWLWINRGKRPHAPEPTQRLPINRSVARVVGAYVDTLGRDPSRKLFSFSKRQAARLFKYYARKAALRPTYRLYSLRHSVGMRLYRHTHDQRMIQAIMGHGRLKASGAYVHVSPEEIREAHALINPEP